MTVASLVEQYALPPEQIEALSLQRVRAALGVEADGDDGERDVRHRIIYAAGDVSLAPSIHVHTEAVARGVDALRGGCSVVVDVRMVEAALDRARLVRLGCTVHCAIDAPSVAAASAAERMPRAVLAMRSLVNRLDRAVVVIGNAPTALLAVLDLVDDGAARPTLIIGMPVGFVAAAESKAELARRDVPFTTTRGPRGGSALAAAATNALLRIATNGEGATVEC